MSRAASSRRVAITGARGVVASHLIPRLMARGDLVLAVLRPGRDASAFTSRGIEVRHADLTRLDPTSDVFQGATSVVHLSGMSQAPGLLPSILRAGVERAVFVSSAGVYTRLASPGADAKRAGESALRATSLAFTILRPSMIYGTPRDRNVVRLLRWIERVPLLPLPAGGKTLQQPVHVEDLTGAILASLDRPVAARREYDVGGPSALTLVELVRVCARALGRPVLTIPIPIGPTYRLVHLARRAGLPCPVTPEQVLRLGESKAVDISPALQDLNFEPRSFEAGVDEEVRLLREAHARID